MPIKPVLVNWNKRIIGPPPLPPTPPIFAKITIVDLCGNRFVDLCGNQFVDLCGNWFVDLCGNWFVDLCGNRFVDLCRNRFMPGAKRFS